MKKFLKKTEGFTLVELIVVIAILGILTAIAVPTYSGYVKKAGEAGDTQTLSAANTAIAAACTENNVERSKTVIEANLSFTTTGSADDGYVVTVGQKITGEASGAALSKALYDDFVLYHGDATIEFNYYKNVTVETDGNLKGVQP